MIAHEISVVQVNPYAVKQTKEVEDNSQLKDDTKDPKLIANLVKDGNFMQLFKIKCIMQFMDIQLQS